MNSFSGTGGTLIVAGQTDRAFGAKLLSLTRVPGKLGPGWNPRFSDKSLSLCFKLVLIKVFVALFQIGYTQVDELDALLAIFYFPGDWLDLELGRPLRLTAYIINLRSYTTL